MSWLLNFSLLKDGLFQLFSELDLLILKRTFRCHIRPTDFTNLLNHVLFAFILQLLISAASCINLLKTDHIQILVLVHYQGVMVEVIDFVKKLSSWQISSLNLHQVLYLDFLVIKKLLFHFFAILTRNLKMIFLVIHFYSLLEYFQTFSLYHLQTLLLMSRTLQRSTACPIRTFSVNQLLFKLRKQLERPKLLEILVQGCYLHQEHRQ